MREVGPGREQDERGAAAGRPASAACSASVSARWPPAESPATTIRSRRVALVEQVAVGRERVLDRGGERRDGRQAVVERERRQAGDVRDARDEVAVRARRAEHVAAAVQVEDDGAVVAVRGGAERARPAHPLGGQAGDAQCARRRCR